MAPNTSKCNHLTPLHFKGLKRAAELKSVSCETKISLNTEIYFSSKIQVVLRYDNRISQNLCWRLYYFYL